MKSFLGKGMVWLVWFGFFCVCVCGLCLCWFKRRDTSSRRDKKPPPTNIGGIPSIFPTVQNIKVPKTVSYIG